MGRMESGLPWTETRLEQLRGVWERVRRRGGQEACAAGERKGPATLPRGDLRTETGRLSGRDSSRFNREVTRVYCLGG